MTVLDQGTVVGIVGAGAMGAGIAQVAAARGHRVVLADSSATAVAKARESHATAFARESEKGRMTAADATSARERVTYLDGVGGAALEAFAPCGLVIEAIIEDLDAKRALFRDLESVIARDAVLATNTSSLSVAALAGGRSNAERVLGIHFFNPAPVMPLVEIVPAITTSPAVASASRALLETWGKTTVVATDTPGFIVNRVARPFYGEALRIAEERLADYASIDWAMRELGGFKMGPFELMDFIGNDVNYAVTRSVFEGMSYDPRYRPSITQRRLVEAGLLGRKAKRGYYDYRDGAVRPEPVKDETLGRVIVDRIVAMLINEAVDALNLRIATVHDLETAMTKGVNYPRGLLAWCDLTGPGTVLATLETLHAEYGEDRYRPSPLLRRIAAGGSFVP